MTDTELLTRFLLFADLVKDRLAKGTATLAGSLDLVFTYSDSLVRGPGGVKVTPDLHETFVWKLDDSGLGFSITKVPCDYPGSEAARLIDDAEAAKAKCEQLLEEYVVRRTAEGALPVRIQEEIDEGWRKAGAKRVEP